jgi:hypothetical protein
MPTEQEKQIEHLTSRLQSLWRGGYEFPNMAEMLINEGVTVKVPKPPEPSHYKMVQVNNGSIWVRCSFNSPYPWKCVTSSDYSWSDWDELLLQNPTVVSF